MINKAYYYIYDIEVPEERRRENEIIEFQVEQIKAYQRKVARLEEENEAQKALIDELIKRIEKEQKKK